MQSDVDERVRESRKDLEAEIRGVAREVSAIADRALARARAGQAGVTPAIEAALTRLDALEREVFDPYLDAKKEFEQLRLLTTIGFSPYVNSEQM